jgi:hypothetical protein
MSTRGSLVFITIMVLSMIMVILTAAQWPYMQAKVLPLVVGGLTFVLSVWQLVKELSTKKKGKQADEKQASEINSLGESTSFEGESTRGWLIEGSWVVALFLGVYVLGYAISIPAYAFAYAKVKGAKLLTAIIWAIALTAVCYVLFQFVIGISMINGLLFEWLGLF